MHHFSGPLSHTVATNFVLSLSLLSGLVSGNAFAQERSVVFSNCPIYRDTDNGRKSGCWLADDPASGLRYDLSDSSTKPMVGRKVLVEGVQGKGADVCGGHTLNPVRVSVLEEPCPELIIPAQKYLSKPSTLPSDFIKPTSAPRDKSAPPYKRRVFELYFDLNSDYFNYQESDTVIERAAHYAMDSSAQSVSVQGFADSAGFQVNGHRFAEDAALAQQRQDKVKVALVGFGMPASVLAKAPVTAIGPPITPLSSLGRRRVVITVDP
jgi:outer membrane protein OmpA-like peptidoglycan-associated protein